MAVRGSMLSSAFYVCTTALFILPLVAAEVETETLLTKPSEFETEKVLSKPSVAPAANETFDLGALGVLFGAQIWHATLIDTFPTTWVMLTPSDFLRKSKKEVCSKVDVAKCMYYGNASNGLPERLQGILWADGVNIPEDAFSTAGVYVPSQRKLTISPTYTRSWGFTATSSVREGLLWTTSGASTYMSNLGLGNYFDIYFNNDFTFGQVRYGLRFLGIPILFPDFVTNFTMVWLGNDMWKRTSAILGISVPTGDYLLKRIVDGKGGRGRYFHEFVKSKNGTPIAVSYPI